LASCAASARTIIVHKRTFWVRQCSEQDVS
jgi:hypothetical protein